MLLIWIGLAIILLVFSKSEIHLFINQYHSTFFDFFFKIYTNVGNGIVPVVLVVILLFISIRKALMLGIASSLAGILAQVFKRFIFPDELRPKLFFENIANVYFVPGVNMYSHHSFPSGHTATAFSVFFVIAVMAKSNLLKFGCMIMAVLVGFSRIYLSQHFLLDVYFGALIGVSCGILSVWYMNRFSETKLDLPIQKI